MSIQSEAALEAGLIAALQQMDYEYVQIAEEDNLEKVLENPQVIKAPVVRNGKQSTLGYQPDIWKTWM